MVTVRLATENDAKEILAIYRYYIEKTAITFEYDVPSLEEFKKRIGHTLEKYPYIVAIKGDKIVGYAYASAFKERAAYDWSIETTIYVDHQCKKQGIGKVLYTALEEILRVQGILNLNACIAYPLEEDQYLTRNSVEYHEHLGYSWIGEFHLCGYKFNTWYDMVWMEKIIGEHTNNQEPVKTLDEVRDIIKKEYNIQ